jgi:hypothetical protein
MGTDGYPDRLLSQNRKPVPWHAQFRLGTTPEQVGRRGGDYQKVGLEALHSMLHLVQPELVELGVNQQRLVPGGANLVEAE